ncbi:hypothetical protein CEXT_708801 [Caerostris extrusa]|uniref:Uncharacterized protein n=1 Tax=Caerostris extrusa TaxID=172846 RepID=A0AAV4VI16_CAEEX|nr:hypothetical protein CEXT_708801 [Caerostris extrusa]
MSIRTSRGGASELRASLIGSRGEKRERIVAYAQPDRRLDIYRLLWYIGYPSISKEGDGWISITHPLPSQFVRQNSMDRAHTPALDRLVDRPYEVLFFPRGLERIGK